MINTIYLTKMTKLFIRHYMRVLRYSRWCYYYYKVMTISPPQNDPV